MSEMSALDNLPWSWFLFGGGLGGVISAVSVNNLRLLPSLATDEGPTGVGHRRVMRIGLLLSAAVGALAPALVVAANADLLDIQAVTAESGFLKVIFSSLLLGFVLARGLAAEIDKGVLRSAVRTAASAPAAHPEVARAIEYAPPYAVYQIASTLVPRRRSFPLSPISTPPS